LFARAVDKLRPLRWRAHFLLSASLRLAFVLIKTFPEMKSLFRFLVFACVLATGVAVLFIWRMQPPVALPQSSLSLEALDREFTRVIAETIPSVVSITALPAGVSDPLARMWQQAPQPSLGSGALVSEDGFLVTNFHVVAQASAAEIQLSDGRIYPAKFIGADVASDVAVLKIDAKNLSPIVFADSENVRVGQIVFAIGNPLGLQETVTHGIISGVGRRTLFEDTKEFFQTDAAINPGNSGGPLVDIHGRLIGLNNHIVQQSEGIGFAIPSNLVRRVYESIREHGRYIRPFFGVQMWPITPEIARQLQLSDTRGALVREVITGSPAARAGVRPSDVILSYNGRLLSDWSDLRNRIAETEPGKVVEIAIKREGQNLTLKVPIEMQPSE